MTLLILATGQVLLLYTSQCLCMPNWYKLLTPYFIYPGKVEITELVMERNE